jgi:peptide/nickel transport system ATP-binding protein/oligopeptide transport system ATP-binding protein
MTTPLLQVEGLTKHFVAKRSLLGRPTSLVKAVDGVSFSVAAGETLALVGESGCGKSTVGRLVLDLIEPTAGTVSFEGRDMAAFAPDDRRKFRAAAQLIFQDPYASLNPRMTIGQTLDEPLMLHTALSKLDRTERVAELLRTVGLQPLHARRYPHEFSGGQRQRIAIARALAVSPKLIVCDEPVSALDVSIRAQVLNLLKDLQQKLGLATIFISHDLSVVKHIADRVAVMYLGRIVETAATDTLFGEPRHPYTQALLSAIPVPTPRAKRERRLLAGDPPSPIDPPAGCHLHVRCPHAVAQCSADVPQLIADAGTHATACHRWRDIGKAGFVIPQDAQNSPSLERLLDAFGRVA